MIGHPRGLPCKAEVADGHPGNGPRVWSFDARRAQTNVHGLQKSSGSPLLDRFGRVVGVMSHRTDATTEKPDGSGDGHYTSWCSRIDLIADLLADLGIPGI